ncbi:transposase [Companilactobacillus alimentarius]|uniref:Transposase n=1 Tax=Companilactobacillus alimentarius DSM 20249 TaxID=1423720 RepID=A0A2K9HNP4_9LACO|nr:hypothetical protein [Companilactobacillus alimentarius]AUI70792.1 hypothetical protein LA20249_00605 [Companilactobacillus alimentarius DSM 20249]KRK77634.1 hypothetical protein FC67_GL000225 [Companilactobacillus alimentarius DSM 20249]MDT6952033.1 transposase [Companilactobacillus alimentarius]GEO45254.1 transposase [Companilactobacillus alimentarius]
MLLSKEMREEMKKYDAEGFKIIENNPWLIPATLAWLMIPTTICIHGFWKNRQLKKQLQIEREKTKQLSANKKHLSLLSKHI